MPPCRRRRGDRSHRGDRRGQSVSSRVPAALGGDGLTLLRCVRLTAHESAVGPALDTTTDADADADADAADAERGASRTAADTGRADRPRVVRVRRGSGAAVVSAAVTLVVMKLLLLLLLRPPDAGLPQIMARSTCHPARLVLLRSRTAAAAVTWSKVLILTLRWHAVRRVARASRWRHRRPPRRDRFASEPHPIHAGVLLPSD